MPGIIKEMIQALILANSGIGLVLPSMQSVELRHTVFDLLKKVREREAAEVRESCAITVKIFAVKSKKYRRKLLQMNSNCNRIFIKL
jgi:hypothetical protein